MKTIHLIVNAALLLLAGNADASRFYEEPSPVSKTSPYRKMVHFNPLALTVGGFEMGYETATANKESFLIHFGYYLSEEAGFLDIKDDYSNMNGLRLDLQYRFYRKSNNYIRNVFLSPYINFKTMTADRHQNTYTYSPVYSVNTITEKKSASTVSFGYMLGMRRSVFENIYLDLSIGGGIFLPVQGDDHKALNTGFINPYQKGVQFKAGFGLLIAL